MANNPQEPQEPKGFFFVWFPVIGLVAMLGIASWQTKAIDKIIALTKSAPSMQSAMATGEGSKKTQLIGCYARLGVSDPESVAKLNALTEAQANDLLYECRKVLQKNLEQENLNGRSNSGV